MKYTQNQRVRIVAIFDDIDQIGKRGKIIQLDEKDFRPYKVQIINDDDTLGRVW